MPRSSTSFGPGNAAATTHGALSAKLWREKRRNLARRVDRELADGRRRYWKRMADRLEWRAQAYDRWLWENGGPIDRRGRERKCVAKSLETERQLTGVYDRLERAAVVEESQDPLSLMLRSRP